MKMTPTWPFGKAKNRKPPEKQIQEQGVLGTSDGVIQSRLGS